MTSLWWILAGIVALLSSGVPALLGPRRSVIRQRLGAALMVVGGALGLTGLALALRDPRPASLDLAALASLGRFSVAVDPISIVFLAPVFVVPVLGALYGLGYWRQSENPANGRKVSFFYGMLAGSMALVVVSRDGVLFLVAWEVMALAAFFAATAEDDLPAVRRAGWIYLVATHVGTMLLFAMFALFRQATGSFALSPVPSEVCGTGLASGIFVLALLGFGFKAGLMPLHVWLPGAHANAPSHVSAVMSGVMLKMGLYGIVRMASLLGPGPVWWGAVLLVAGVSSGILGLAFAIAQHDLKRLLAYSSIENIGIIAMGVGLALLGRSLNRMDWVVLGLGGALLHVWNHSLFKSLLFLGAGAVIHATGTRQIDRLGGLAGRMPRVTCLFALASVAICALPPLNGFAGEWLLYLGLFGTLGTDGGVSWPTAALAAAALAMIGALAVVCFVKLFGVMFLGGPRSGAAIAAHDPGMTLLGPMAALAAGCLVLGILPWLTVPLLDRAAENWAGGGAATIPPILSVAPLSWISVMGVVLMGAVAALGLPLRLLLRRRNVASAGTWDCGYARPAFRMQYTGSSFGQTLAALFAWALWPVRHAPQIQGFLPTATRYQGDTPDTVLERLILPIFHMAERLLPRLRLLQQGKVHIYVVYFLLALLALLLWGRLGN
ncbi:MAG: proton-conducting transporter membrane subunit [Lentisphaeria bacterium]|nr:proton-conducting transporter membrane subunit [Lentisphaeria bacterium]